MKRLTPTFGDLGVSWASSDGEIPKFPLSSWPPDIVQELEPLEQWSALASGWAADQIEEHGPGKYYLPYERCFELAEDLPETLGLPLPQPVHLSLRSEGSAAQEKFRIVCDIKDEDGKTFKDAKYVGPFYVRNSLEAVGLSKSVSDLIRLTVSGPGEGAGLSQRLLYLAEVKKKAAAIQTDKSSLSKIFWDSYIENEQISTVESIGFNPTVISPGHISLTPTAETNDETTFDIPGGVLRGGASTPTTFNAGGAVGSSTRKRVVLRPEDRDVAHEIDAQEIKGTNVPRFVVNPEAFLPDSIDLKDYSDRVKSIGVTVYNSRPYVHLRKDGKTGWLEGALEIKTDNLVDDVPVSDPSPIERPTISPQAFTELASKCDDDGWVQHGDSWVQVDGKGADFLNDLSDAGYDTSTAGYQRFDGVLNVLSNIDKDEEYSEYYEDEDGLLPEYKPGLEKVPLAQSFVGKLYDYQIQAYRWLSGLYKTQRGGLLADEMGLGKTVQVLAHIARVLEIEKERPILIVVPLTLMENWMREIQTFLDPVPKIHWHKGSKHRRLHGLQSRPDLVLVSYDTLRRDQLEMARIDWSVVICDEAQFVKNPTAQRTSVVKALKADQRIALTGTPVENGLIEFWCILDYVSPGLFGTWSEFRADYERPIVEAASSADRSKLVERLMAKCGVHFRRRLKKDVRGDLTALGEPCRETIPLSKQQFIVYQHILREAKKKGRGGVLGAIQKLLQCCALPPDRSAPIEEQIKLCPKLEKTLDVIGNIRDREEKCLIFTRFIEIQTVLQRAIAYRFGIVPECINGSVHGNRQAVIDHFSQREGFGVLVLSHDVAGVGLNVTAANHVIHYTRPWNPAKEDQATGRAHRIGQEKEVKVYLPIVKQEDYVTIEDALDGLLKEKQQLARDVLLPIQDGEISSEELFNYVKDVDVLTDEQIDRFHGGDSENR